jgi:hypothetical protein
MPKRKRATAARDVVQFDASPEDRALVRLIVERAAKLTPPGEAPLTADERTTLSMDLLACHANGNPMNFQKLLSADQFNFAHDVNGISKHIDRDTGALRDHFSPRCSA